VATQPEAASRGSAEARVLLRPAATYRELAAVDRGSGSFYRRPLFLAFVLGCAASAFGSGRFSADLIVDGAVSWAFVPASEVVAFGVVFWLGLRRAHLSDDQPVPFRRLLDVFLVANAPWLAWAIGVMSLAIVIPPRQFGTWFMPVIYTMVVPMIWAAYLDYQFFRLFARQPSRRAIGNVVIVRVICWLLTTWYFAGLVLVTEIDARLPR
jgi:hypothetical protein